jgi:2-dehydro-3-deoxy-D-arabinonate dehydratase
LKLLRFWKPGYGPALGLLCGAGIYDLTALDPEKFGSFSGVLRMAAPESELATAFGRLKTPTFGLEQFSRVPDGEKLHFLAPITRQEVWAAGVTYFRSREARMEESADGGSFYDLVYNAARPELFFKGTASRVSAPGAPIRIRFDSKWNVPEPELALVIGPDGRLFGFTIGNDVSSRDIEGENPLYLPQAKVYRGSCALGPVVLMAGAVPDARQLEIRLAIRRDETVLFQGSTSIERMKRNLGDLIEYLFREQEFPDGVILLTGTGIVPSDDFTLMSGDVVEITVPEIGTLCNIVE